MPLNLSALRNLRPVQVPDPVKSIQEVQAYQGAQQQNQLRGLQVQGAQQELDAGAAQKQSIARVHEVIAKYGGELTDKALAEINQIDPKLGQDLAKSHQDILASIANVKNQETDNAETRNTNLFNQWQAQLKQETEATKPIEVSPGASLMNPSGGVIGTAPAATPKLSFEEQTAQSWLAANPGKTINDYQTMDANRRKPVTNIFLDQQRKQSLEDSQLAAPGQIISKTTKRPISPQSFPESARARIEGLQTAIQQADVVEKALLALGNTGAVKGFIEENGVYWPVVQDNLSPEQAEAVSETQRLLSSYAQAVSGLAVSEPEINRLKKSAPSLRMTPEANKKIIGHFRRNAENKINNYLNNMGWEFKKGDSGTGGSLDDEIMNAIKGGK